MKPPATGDYVREFVEEVLRTGSMLLELLDDLIEMVPEDCTEHGARRVSWERRPG
jgi:hypothetical protein